MADSSTNRALAILGAVVILAAWASASYLGLFSKIFLPSPGATLAAMWQLLVSGDLLPAVIASFSRIAEAMVLVIIIGVPVGIVAGSFAKVDALLSPIIQPSRYLPVTALLPLFILWFGIGQTMKVAFLFFGAIVYLLPMVRDAVKNFPASFLEVARDLNLNRLETITKVVWPGTLPQIWRAIIVCNAIGWNYVVLAEIINPQKGLGHLINIAGRVQRSDKVFAGIIVIAVVAIISDRILTALGKRWFGWERTV